MIKLQSACLLVGMPETLVRAWIRAGVIAPAIRGAKGKGNCSLFSGKQLAGLAFVGVIYRNFYSCDRECISRFYGMYSGMTEDAFRHYLMLEPVPESSGDGGATVELLHFPGEDKFFRDLDQSMRKVAAFILSGKVVQP